MAYQSTVYPTKGGDAELAAVTLTGALALARATMTYGTTVTPDASLGNQVVTVTDGVAFAMAAPLNPTTGQRMVMTIRNTSGGAVGAITWNAIYKKAAFTTPATANSRSVEFLYDGTNWIMLWQSAADVAN